jgi:hypothetical protein
MNKSIIYNNKNHKILTVNGGALIYETYPNSDAKKKKIEGDIGFQYFSALWKYFIKIYNKQHGKYNEIINKLSIDTIDILNCFDSSNNMLKLDFEYLGNSITLQVINNSNKKLLKYYIFILFKDLYLHLTIHFNRKYDNVRHSKASVIFQEQAKGSVKGSVMTGISDISKTSSHTEMRFSDDKSILTPIHLTSDTKYRSYYMSIERIDYLIKSLIELKPEEYDRSLYLNTIIPGVFIGSFCSELVYLFTSSFIINRIVKKIDDKLSMIDNSGQKIDITNIIEVVKRDIDEEKFKIKDTNVKLYNSLKTISDLIDFMEETNITGIKRYIKRLLFGIEGFKDINTFLYDTELIRGNDGTIRTDTELQNLRTFFSNQQTFKEYCDKYYNNKKSDCDVANYKAKDIMGNVVDRLTEDNVIALIGNLALKELIDTIEGLNKISANESINFLLRLSDELFVTMDMLTEQYKDGIHLKNTFDNLKKILIKWKKYKKKHQIPLAISHRESSQQPSISQVSSQYPQEQPDSDHPDITQQSQHFQHSQQLPQHSQQLPQHSQQLPQHSQQLPQHSQHFQHSQQLPQHSQQLPQQSQQLPQHSQQLPQHSQHFQHSQQLPQQSQQLPQHSQQFQHSQQLPQQFQQLPQHSQHFQHSQQLPQQFQQLPQQFQQLPQQFQQLPQQFQQLPQQFQQLHQQSQHFQHSQQLPQQFQQLPQQFQQLPQQFQQLSQFQKLLEFSEIRMKMLQDIKQQKINILKTKTSNSFDEEIIYDDIFNIDNDISLLDNYINNIRKNIQGLQRYGGSKNVSKVINRYLDKIKEIRGIIKELNDNKKKNKSKILTKRMQIKNLFTKIKIQREKEKEKEKEKKKKKQRNKAKNTKKAG